MQLIDRAFSVMFSGASLIVAGAGTSIAVVMPTIQTFVHSINHASAALG